MTTKYGKKQPNKTPQTQPIPGKEARMQPNAAGGYTFKMGDADQFRRWLILGSEAATHYQDSDELTRENFDAIDRLMATNPELVVPLIEEVRRNNWALRQSPAIFGLAYASTKDATKAGAFSILDQISQNGSQLMEFIAARKDLTGKAKSSRAFRTAVAHWYNGKKASDLAYQLLKYRTRNGFSNLDVLRLFHVKPATNDHAALFAWLADKPYEGALSEDGKKAMAYIAAFNQLQSATDAKAAAAIIREFRFTREMVPTQLLNSKEVWAALVETMPYLGLIRNLNKITEVGLIDDFGTGEWIKRITDPVIIKKSRVHPMHLLIALKQYQLGEGHMGKKTWTPMPQITAALEDAFYLSFANVEPLDKNIVVAVDVSGSMEQAVYGISNMQTWEAAAAMALVYLHANPRTMILAFDDKVTKMTNITTKTSLTEAMNIFKRMSHGGTDCSLPFEYIQQNKIAADGVLMITDSETWHGHQHVTQARDNTIRFFNIQTTAGRAFLNDLEDTGWMEVNGFSADTLTVANLFFKGLI